MPRGALIIAGIARKGVTVEDIPSLKKQKESGKIRFLHDRRPRGTPDLQEHLTPVQYREVGRRYFPRAGTLYIELKDEAQVDSVCTALQSFGDINRVPPDEFLSNRAAAEKYKKDCQETLGCESHTGLFLTDDTYTAYHNHEFIAMTHESESFARIY